ncbi:alpha/beta hydrolase family protein [Streptomyces aureocirculatus]|uniref:hypothetical protein n=1 Tax=Streptomyces aureocirculatus TaxID=67275 RepID=UPI00069163DE|nr:hypothetical protein [Streptomyces aureocirculatus]
MAARWFHLATLAPYAEAELAASEADRALSRALAALEPGARRCAAVRGEGFTGWLRGPSDAPGTVVGLAGLAGLSLGGSIAARAAALEPRVAAVATASGPFRLDWDELPPPVRDIMAGRAGGPVPTPRASRPMSPTSARWTR